MVYREVIELLYPNLKAEMGRNGIKNIEIAKCLEVNLSTITAKFTIPDRIKLAECYKIRNKFFPDLSMEYLFATKK